MYGQKVLFGAAQAEPSRGIRGRKSPSRRAHLAHAQSAEHNHDVLLSSGRLLSSPRNSTYGSMRAHVSQYWLHRRTVYRATVRETGACNPAVSEFSVTSRP